MTPAPKTTILYDRDCGFCRWSVGRIMSLDRRQRLSAVAIQSEQGERLLAELSEEERLDSWHLVDPEGRRYSAGAAFAPLARLLPGGAPLAALASRYPGAAERLYRAVAEHRAGFGRLLRRAQRGLGRRG